MTNLPWLSILLVLPAAGALVIALLPASSRHLVRPLALLISLLELAVGITTVSAYQSASAPGPYQLTEIHSWIPQFGVSYALGVDGISLSLIVMSLVLVPISILAAWRDVDPESGRRFQNYFAWMLLLETMMIGVFASIDAFLFYVFFEVMLVPVYFLIGLYGGKQRQYAAMKFLLFGLAGGFIMLVALAGVYFYGPGGSEGFLLTNLTGLEIPSGAEKWLFVGFFLPFAMKAPMWPVHTWLPDAASEAKPATAVLLVGVLDKVGTFGMIRFCLELFPGASEWATPVVMVLALISVFYGAIAAIGQDDMMRLIAYTSLSHFGFIILGIFSVTTVSSTGAALYMVNHGITTAALFFFAGMLMNRRGSRMISDFGGWQRVTPVLTGVFLIAGLSALSLPGTNSFVSEYLVLVGTFSRNHWVGGIAALAVVLAAIYIMWMVKRVSTGPKPDSFDRDGKTISTSTISDLNPIEKAVAVPLVALILVLGFFPGPVLDLVRPAVKYTQSITGQSDPALVNSVVNEGGSK